jgi:hypothetical protein
MKEKLRILIANIEYDLESIDKIKTDFDFFMNIINNNIPDKFQKPVIGYHMHNFYNACENIFLNIAKTFENNIEPQEWHKSILRRMKLDIEDIRPAVISDELYRILEEFRGFRHMFRYSYSFDLDWAKEKLAADKFNDAVIIFKNELCTFIDFLKSICADV